MFVYDLLPIISMVNSSLYSIFVLDIHAFTNLNKLFTTFTHQPF